jgi:hypothetical protein
MPRSTRITFDDLGDGIDRRGGIVGRSAKKFEDLDNYYTTSGRKIAMRPPLLRYTGDLDRTLTQGCEYLNGRIVTVAKLGALSNSTTAETDCYYFDNPEGATTWELLELKMYTEKVCALIRHYFPNSTAAPYRNYLHVFDEQRPTYTEDPAMPQSWTARYPLLPYGDDEASSYKDYPPRMEIIGERLAMTTPGGDVGMCAVQLPRVWNTWTPAEILANGEMFYRILDASVGAQQFIIPVPFLTLRSDQRYAAYVCEYYQVANGIGRWTQFTEVSAVSNPGEYSVDAYANRFDSDEADETRITVYLSGACDGTLIRFRAIADPPAVIVSGINLTAKVVSGQLTVEGGNITGGTMVHEGKSFNLQTSPIPTLETPGEAVLISVQVPGSPVEVPTIIAAATDSTLGLNGQQRYWSRIIAAVNANDTEQQRIETVRCLSGYRDNSGAGTLEYYIGKTYKDYELSAPNTEGLTVGDKLRIGDVYVLIAEITAGSRYVYKEKLNPEKRKIKGGCIRCTIVSGQAESVFPLGAPSAAQDWYLAAFNGGYTYAIDGRTTIEVGGTKLVGALTNYVNDLRVGKNVEINGEVRKVISISGADTAEVELPFTTAGEYIALRDPRYEYAYDVGETGNDWYAEKEADITFRGAGRDDAVWLGCSNYDDSGQQPLAIAAMQNRMLVQFPSQIQSWAVGASISQFALLSVMGQGAGANTRPRPALVDGFAALPTANGPRLFAPESDGKDYIQFIPVGDMLRGFTFPDFTRAVWWPRLRCFVTCAGSGADMRLFTLSVHKEAKVLAWSMWNIPASVTTVDNLLVRGDDLVVQSGVNLYYFDPDAVSFIDFDGNPVSAVARWIYNDLGNPQSNKKLISVDIIQTGKSTVSVYVNPRVPANKVLGPALSGESLGIQRLPIMAMGPGVALEVASTDTDGHSLDQIGFDYMLLNR